MKKGKVARWKEGERKDRSVEKLENICVLELERSGI